MQQHTRFNYFMGCFKLGLIDYEGKLLLSAYNK